MASIQLVCDFALGTLTAQPDSAWLDALEKVTWVFPDLPPESCQLSIVFSGEPPAPPPGVVLLPPKLRVGAVLAPPERQGAGADGVGLAGQGTGKGDEACGHGRDLPRAGESLAEGGGGLYPDG